MRTHRSLGGILAIVVGLAAMAGSARAIIDPATFSTWAIAIADGADAANKVKILLGIGKSDDGATRKALDAIQTQNRITHAKLDQVLTILGNLGVIVQDAVRSELVVGSKTSLIGRIQAVEDKYDASFGNGAERQVAAQTFRSQRPEIEATAGQLMNTGTYGFGHYDAVGQAMTAEYAIMIRLKEPKSTFKKRAARYRAFFDSVADTKTVGSVGYTAIQTQQRRDRLATALAKADASLPNDTVLGKSRTYTVGNCDYYTSQLIGVRKDAAGVYQVAHVGDTPPALSGCESNGGGGTRLAGDITDPDDPGSANPTARAKYLNDTVATIAELDRRLGVLNPALATVEQWRANAKMLETASK